MNVFIALKVTHFLFLFDLNLANKRQRKVIIRHVWLLRTTARCRHDDMTSIERYVLLQMSMTWLTRNVA